MNVSMAGSSGMSPTQMAQELFKKADANGDGGIDKSELKTTMANGPGGSQKSSDVDKIFAKMDTDGDGKITQDEMDKVGKEMQSRMGKSGPAGGAAGEAPSDGGAKTSGTGGSSESAKVYDAKDTNKDGTVSAQEEMQYALKHLGDSEDGSSSKASDVSEKTKKVVDALMKQLEKETKYGEQGTTSVAAGGMPTLLSTRV